MVDSTSRPHTQSENPHSLTPLGLAARFDRLPSTRYQRKLLLILATAWFLDSFDISSITFAISSMRAELDITAWQVGLVISSGFAGMAIGATSAGALADRFGRKAILQYSIILLGIASFLTAIAWDLVSLVCFRVLLGIGIGAEFPVAQALLAETVPTRHRGKAIGWVAEYSAVIAFLVAGSLSLLLIPLVGWRGLYVFQGLLSLFVIIVRRHMPESPRWHLERGDTERAHAVMTSIEQRTRDAYGAPLPEPATPDATAVDSRPARSPLTIIFAASYRRRTVMMLALWFFGVLGYYSIQSWISQLLTISGLSIADSNQFVLLMLFWALPGVFVSGLLLERIGRKATLVAFLAASAVTAFFYGGAGSELTLIITGSLMQFSFYGMWTALYAYTAEVFPTRARSTGAGMASTMGRIGAIIGPLLLPLVLGSYGMSMVFVIVGIVPFALAAAIVAIFGPETKQRVLEEVSS